MQHRQLPSVNKAACRVSSVTRWARLLSLLVMLAGLSALQPENVAASSTSVLHQAEQSGAVNVQPSASQHPQLLRTSISKPFREVFGFALASSLSDPTFGYPSWNFSLLTTVAFFALHVNTNGTFAGDSSWSVWNSSQLTGLLSVAHANGTKVVVTIDLQDFAPGTPNMCAGLASRATTVSQTVAAVAAKGVDGVNVDYEGLNGTCPNGQSSQSMMTDLVHQLRSALPSGSYLSVDTYASSAADPLGFFDIPGLSAYADSFFVMAYDLEYANYRRAPLGCVSFCLGPTAPLTGYYYNDTSTASEYTAAVPASKVILGVPYYGRKACVSSASPNQYPAGSVIADTYLDASQESGDPAVRSGSYASHRDANDPSGQERWDTWFNTTLNCTRELYWDDTTSLGLKYDLVNTDGLRGVGIWNLNYGGGAPELWSALSGHFVGCSGVTASPNAGSPQPAGTRVQLTAKATSCPNPLYEFWMLAPGSTAWALAQAYSTNATYSWDTTGKPVGTYVYSVWARDANSAGISGNSSGRWDAYNSIQYSLVAKPCTALTFSAVPASPAPTGAAVTIVATASACPNPSYQFWILAPGASAWTLAQAYSTNANFHWDTTGKAAGAYGFSVWARDASSAGTSGNSSGTWDAYNSGQYTLSAHCAAVSVASAPSSSARVGTAVTFTAGGSGCPNPLYQFWVLAPGATGWQLAQAYSATATFSWTTTGKAAGVYYFSVWVRDASSAGMSGNSSGRWDAYNSSQYTLSSTPCTAVSLSSSPASTAKAGTAVTLSAAASGCPNASYQFWLLAPGATSWQLVQAYSTTAIFSWNTAGKPAGTYRISVWVRDASSDGTSSNASGSWDAYNSGQYTLT